jgi:dynein heavy chain
MVAKKEGLENKMEICKIKLDRAIKLTSGLSGEKVRWTEDISSL